MSMNKFFRKINRNECESRPDCRGWMQVIKRRRKKRKKDHNDILEKPGKRTKFVKTALETAKNRTTKTRKAKEQSLAEKR